MNIDKLNKYLEEGWLMNSHHPTLPLIIWNYTNKTVYEQKWDKVTLKCRGLVTDEEGVEINNPIPKFFNFSETRGKYSCDFKRKFQVFTKYDGSLILMFRYKNELIITSRGSFISDQAIWAKEIIKEGFKKDKNLNFLSNISHLPQLTFIFELIHPENRIVVNYSNKKKLVLLAIRNLNGEDYDFKDILIEPSSYIEKAKIHTLDIKKFKDLKTLQKLNLNNEEGYIFKFKSGKRVKVKFEEYLRLHRIISGLTNKSIWESLKNGDDIELMLKGIPDEMYETIKKEILLIQIRFNSVYVNLNSYYLQQINFNITDRKSFSTFVKNSIPKDYQHFMYSKYDKTIDRLRNQIWQFIKPDVIKKII